VIGTETKTIKEQVTMVMMMEGTPKKRIIKRVITKEIVILIKIRKQRGHQDKGQLQRSQRAKRKDILLKRRRKVSRSRSEKKRRSSKSKSKERRGRDRSDSKKR